VLIAEDNESTREVLAWCMRVAGWDAEEVANGLEALTVAPWFEPDAIIMDLDMPLVDGVAAMRGLRSDPRTAAVPVIAYTAHVQDHDVAELKGAGFGAVIPKPCDPEDIRALIENMLKRR
jgi:two-component system cell cycle response regulator DivK